MASDFSVLFRATSQVFGRMSTSSRQLMLFGQLALRCVLYKKPSEMCEEFINDLQTERIDTRFFFQDAVSADGCMLSDADRF